MNNPNISIITVTYNAEAFLERTIKSIVETQATNIQYIIVDGASSDGTLDIIRKYQKQIAHWVSETDRGIYDAMNKGLSLATGDFVWFLNAGDEVYDKSTIQKIFPLLPVCDIVYGQTMIVDNDGIEIGLRRLRPSKNFTWREYRFGQKISHQSFIARREICGLYDLRYKHSADTDWQIEALRSAKRVCDSNLILSRFLDGGKSKQNIVPSIKERFQIMIRNYGLFITLWSHIIITYRFIKFLLRHRRF